jgi:hypothetical protein
MQLLHLISFILIIFASFVSSAHAWDAAGDTIALLIGLFIAFIGVCALLGWWSRRGESQ